jgi:hypothetical protein
MIKHTSKEKEKEKYFIKFIYIIIFYNKIKAF